MKISSVIHVGVQKALDKKINKYIEIVGSGNPRLNSMAKDSQLSILKVLNKHFTHVAITIVNNIDDLDALVAKKPDLVVLGMKLILLDPSKSYDDSPKVWLSSYLKKNGINFTGSEAAAFYLEFDKPKAKQKIIEAGLKSSAYFISRLKQPTFEHSLRFPLFVKPTNRGDSKGIDENSVVYSQFELESKILAMHKSCDSDALIEEYLPGREFSVAVTKQLGSDDLLAMPIEITTPVDKKGNSFLSKSVKDADSEKVIAINEPKLRKTISALAIGVFKALGSRDYGRIDMRLDSFGIPTFIEANLMPGLSDHGYLSRCFYINQNIDYDSMIMSIVNLGLARNTDTPEKIMSANLRGDSAKTAATQLAATGIII